MKIHGIAVIALATASLAPAQTDYSIEQQRITRELQRANEEMKRAQMEAYRSQTEAMRAQADAMRGPALMMMQPAPPAPPVPPVPPVVTVNGGSYLGVGVQEVTSDRAKALKLSEERGVEVTMVSEDSPASKAGLQKGDVVLEYNGQRVEGVEQFVRFVHETPAGRNVRLTISRDGRTQTVTAAVSARRTRNRDIGFAFEAPNVNVWIPDVPRPNMAWRSSMLGLEGESVEGQLAQYFGVKQGVLVRSVNKGSSAEKSGLKAGDVITKVDQTGVDTPRELSDAIRSERNRKAVPLTLMRDRKEMTLTVSIDDERSDSDQRRSPARSVRRREF